MNDRESYRKPNERIDDLQRDGLYILQDPNRFCFGIDQFSWLEKHKVENLWD